MNRRQTESRRRLRSPFVGLFLSLFLAESPLVSAKEIALTFDDAPVGDTLHFRSIDRTNELIKKLKDLKVPSAMIFANPCKRNTEPSVIHQIRAYHEAGHSIGNHTCSHPKLDQIGFQAYAANTLQADHLLSPFFDGQRFFRFPYLNEGSKKPTRDSMRSWLKRHDYRNGMVSVDNDDYFFSFKLNQAKKAGNSIDYPAVQELFLNHVLGAVDFYDDLAQKTIGYSPMHVLLLHEMDATVLYLVPLVQELRRKGWKIIDPRKAYEDPLYQKEPKNTAANNGILAQIWTEKTEKKIGYSPLKEIETELDRILGL